MLRSADSFLAICEKFDSGNDEAEIRPHRLHELRGGPAGQFLAIAMWITYWCGAIGMAILAVKNEAKHICQLLLPGIFFLLHLSYGVGSVVGMGKMIKDKITKK